MPGFLHWQTPQFFRALFPVKLSIMLKRILKTPLLWPALILGIVLLLQYALKEDVRTASDANLWQQLPVPEEPAIGWLIKPFLMPEGDLEIALDGGELPLLSIAIPELSLGEDARHPLQLVLLVDWRSETSRELLRQLEQLYQNVRPGEFLPSLRLRLLPIGSAEESHQIHKMITRCYLMSTQEDTFPALLKTIIQRSSAPTLPEIEALLHAAEPDLLERIRAADHWDEDPAKRTFTAAEAQLKRNTALLNVTTNPQLTSIRQILTTAPGRDALIAYLSAAMAYQDAYISSPRGLMPISQDFGCHCQDPQHTHQAWKPAIFQRFPDLVSLPDSQPETGEIAASQPDSTSPGPQINLHAVVQVTGPIHPGQPVVHTVSFQNVGDQELEVREILVDGDATTLLEWDRRVPPAGEGTFTLQLHHQVDHASTRSIWLRTNSLEISHSTLGHEVILRIPARLMP